ncbi:MAG: DUF5028 domain-containing protein [Lachnospiraceae bacterium]|nr:DUF5028 domain-containing protein [Lachnospiraceae bacterium]
MKKILYFSLIVVLTFAWGIRFYLVNREIDLPVALVFQKGEEVPIEKDFFINSDEGMDGYNVTVLDAELVSVENFLQSYNAVEEAENIGSFTDYIYMVRVSFGNQNNPFINEKGIDLQVYYLKGTDYVLSLEDTCYRIANPDMPGTSFSLRQGTDMELILPFSVMSSQTSRKHVLDDTPKLQISLYPHQKLIKLY